MKGGEIKYLRRKACGKNVTSKKFIIYMAAEKSECERW